MNYANQKKVYINKDEIQKLYNKPSEKDGDQFLHSLSWEELLPITRELNGNEFKLWLYCMKWTGKSDFYFSPAALINDFNISESTAQRGFKKLEALGYLVKRIDGQGYDFHPRGMRSK
jgi:hypothetical protein